MPQEKGFTPLLFILVIVFLSSGIIGGSLYFKNVYRPNIHPLPEPTTSPENSPSTSPLNKSDDLSIFRSKDGSFIFKYPSKWIFEEAYREELISENIKKKYLTNIVTFFKILPTITSDQKDKSKLSKKDYGTILQFSYSTSPDYASIDLEKLLKDNFGNSYISSKDVNVSNNLKVKEIRYKCYEHKDLECIRSLYLKGDTLFIISNDNYSFPVLEDPYKILSTFEFAK